MNKRQIGIAVITLSIVFFLATLSLTLYTNSLNKLIHQDCGLPEGVCPFNKAVPNQSIIGFSVVALLAAFGIYLVVQKEPKMEKGRGYYPMDQKISGSKNILKTSIKELKPEEKKILDLIAEEGAIFQTVLVEKSGLSKVKVTRILDVLEGKGLVERKRRGMSNVVILKNS